MSRYLDALRRRVLVCDGALGTSLQALDLSAADYGGAHFQGCADHLVLTCPDAVESVHADFLEVGCDMVETNTFRANRLSLGEYGLQSRVLEINREAALLARRVADRFSTSDRPRFVAGSIGPSGRLPGGTDPELSGISFDELAQVFREQAQGLAEGGADLLLIETSQDMLEVKAQIAGIRRFFREAGVQLPIQAQVTLDINGRMLLGTDIGAAMTILEGMRVDVIGLNCSTGPDHMRAPVRFLTEFSYLPVSVMPNAGIPRNEAGVAVYPLSAQDMAASLEEFVVRFGVAVVGGCCGTTPEHMRQVVQRVGGRSPVSRQVPSVVRAASAIKSVSLAQEPAPALVGERLNAQGSRRVKRLLLEDDYDGLVQIALDQVEGGAHFLDVCVALSESEGEADRMARLVKLLAQSVETPLFLDSTEPAVLEAGLKQYPGRAVINSINLEDGCQRADAILRLAAEHGAAVVALVIDHDGMARNARRKLAIARRILKMAVEDHGLRPHDVIIDCLTFSLATGTEDYRRSAVETMEGIKTIKAQLPGVMTLLGVSNVSHGLHGRGRAVLNSVFLHRCVQAGLDMAIVNPAHVIPLAEIPPEELALADDLIHARSQDSLSRFAEHFQARKAEPLAADPVADLQPEEALRRAILRRRKDGVAELVASLVRERGGGHDAAVQVLNQVLLPAMKEVGEKFDQGHLILPFVLQSAEVMKHAVGCLEPHLDRAQGHNKGCVVLATVEGDVHDIGKNLVRTVLLNNGYTVHDLGKQVPVNTIIQRAVEVDADAIGLSALLVSTSRQLPRCVQELHARNLRIPVLAGGAAMGPAFVRRASLVDDGKDTPYEPGVYYCKDALEGLSVVDALTDPTRRDRFVREHQEAMARQGAGAGAGPVVGTDKKLPAAGAAQIPEPPFRGSRVLQDLPLDQLFQLVDRKALYRLHWGARNAKGKAWQRLVAEEFEPRLERLQEEALLDPHCRVKAAYGYFPAVADGDVLVVLDPERRQREMARFRFPRQPDRGGLSLADYFLPGNGESHDVAAFQVVTLDEEFSRRAEAMLEAGQYGEGYYLHGFGVRLVEAGAQWMHRLIRRELSIPEDRGLRYSWGYPACPDIRQHELVFRLLPAREELGMDLTSAGALVPALSTAGLVVHHPECRYFPASRSDSRW